MAQTSIKRDSHGLYIRTNGEVYRPQPARYTYYHHEATDGSSKFADGERVNVRHVSQTPFARVQRDGIKELWHGHGMYLGGVKSDDCWQPK